MRDVDALVAELRKIADWFAGDYGYNHASTCRAAADALESERSRADRLEKALTAADYLIDRYRRTHRGQCVRDLDEAGASYSCALAAIAALGKEDVSD